MTNTIFISDKLNEAIKKCNWTGSGVTGFLVGQSDDPSTILALWKIQIPDISAIGQYTDGCLSHFPCGRNIIGLAFMVPQNMFNSLQSKNMTDGELEQALSQTIGPVDSILESLELESAVGLCLCEGDNESTSLQEWNTPFLFLTKSGVKTAKISHDMNLGTYLRMRLKANIPIQMSAPSNQDGDWSCVVQEEFMKLQSSAEAGGFAFGFDGNRALVYKGGMTLGSNFRNWKLVKDIKKYLKDAAEQREEEVARPVGKGPQKPIEMSLLQLGSNSRDGHGHGPIIAHKKGTFSSVKVILPLDILVEVNEDLAIQKLYRMLTQALSRQISIFEECLNSLCLPNKMYSPEVFHFKPSIIDTAVSFVYEKDMAEEELECERSACHDRLLIPMDRPCFRKASAGIFINPTAPGGYLINPHIGLNIPNSVRSGTVSIVEGYYSYHHYMQDRFNDDKWGCAYRSLQTIVSWFKYQGYTDKSIPAHRDIQEALYKCGDKGEKFVGSRQWIGSFEVSYVLDHLLGVSSKFINVNSGADLATTGQQLLYHFQSQGTPVMIGGGVLAHTILGVAYDEATGDIAFLILDPHYTGGEDLKLVQDKGWCGWKDMKFWDQTAHYNMCLPQRPIIV